MKGGMWDSRCHSVKQNYTHTHTYTHTLTHSLTPPHTHHMPHKELDVDLSKVLDPHTVTGLLKVHFREQRVSLIPRGQPLAEIVQAVKSRNVRECGQIVK